MTSYRFSTVRDLRNWVDGVTVNWPDRTDEVLNELTEAIRAMDHPAWGDDWTDFLDSLPENLFELVETE